MEDNEIFVSEELTENTEELSAEELVDGVKEEEIETPKAIYTEEDFNRKLDEVLARKIARKEAKIRKEYEDKYANDLELANITKQGIGEEDTKEAVNRMTEFYKEKGIEIKPMERESSKEENEAIANFYADKIIKAGYEDIVEEVEQLANKGYENMNPREKIIFNKLAMERTNIENEKYLASQGVTKEFLENKEFKEFSDKYPSLSLKDKYELYEKIMPKKEVKPIGSMKNTEVNKTKDFYTMEEISRLTEDDLDDPEVWEIVRKSMTSRK